MGSISVDASGRFTGIQIFLEPSASTVEVDCNHPGGPPTPRLRSYFLDLRSLGEGVSWQNNPVAIKALPWHHLQDVTVPCHVPFVGSDGLSPLISDLPTPLCDPQSPGQLALNTTIVCSWNRRSNDVHLDGGPLHPPMERFTWGLLP